MSSDVYDVMFRDVAWDVCGRCCVGCVWQMLRGMCVADVAWDVCGRCS